MTTQHPVMIPAVQVAELIGVHLNTVYREAQKGNIPGCIRIGNRYLFNEEIILQWLSGEYEKTQA